MNKPSLALLLQLNLPTQALMIAQRKDRPIFPGYTVIDGTRIMLHVGTLKKLVKQGSMTVDPAGQYHLTTAGEAASY